MSNTANNSYDIKCLNIAQINIRSIVSHAKREEFRAFLRQYKPHIVLLSETHLKSRHKVFFEGYKFYRCDRLNASHGGTAICINETIESSQVKTPESTKSIELCTVKIESVDGPIFVSSVYRKPTIGIKCDDLSVIINLSKNGKYIIAGDFNAHCSIWGSNKMCTNGRAISDWFGNNESKYKMKIVAPAKPSCNTNGVESYIDFAIMSRELQILNCDINGKLPSNEIFSDHSVIHMKIACDKLQSSIPNIIKNFKKTNWVNFNNYVSEKINDLSIPVY